MEQVINFGKVGKDDVEKIVISSKKASASILTYGATLQAFNAFGVDIVVGSEDPSKFDNSKSHMGQVVGPFANRIKGASFTLNGEKYDLTVNNNSNCLHSGTANYGNKIWKVAELEKDRVKLTYSSEENAGGFPGKQDVSVTYTLKGSRLLIEYAVVATKPCPFNITNHAYFNLNGDNSDILDHEIKLNAPHYVEVDKELIPTAVLPVMDTDFDFTTPHKIKERRGGKYDHCFLFGDKKRGYLTNGKLKLFFETDLPGVQIYTGEFLTIENGKHGDVGAFGGVAIETEFMPDSPNHPEYPGFVLVPGKEFRTFTSYEVKPYEC